MFLYRIMDRQEAIEELHRFTDLSIERLSAMDNLELEIEWTAALKEPCWISGRKSSDSPVCLTGRKR